jgi:dTDP-4-dehydrorhamnose reductase
MSIYESVVITGGGGMLGHALSDALRGRGVAATALPHGQCNVAYELDVRRIFVEHRRRCC